MFVRLVNFTGAKDIDGGLEFLRDTVAPLLRQQNGWAGTTASVDRATSTFTVLSLWQSEADRDASEAALRDVRAQAQDIVGGELTVDMGEQVVFDIAAPPRVGSRLLVRRVQMDPSSVDENIEFFKSEILPRIKSGDGYLAVRNIVNRKTGEGAVGSLWDGDEALEAAAQKAEERRSLAEGRDITLGELSKREVVFADLP